MQFVTRLQADFHAALRSMTMSEQEQAYVLLAHTFENEGISLITDVQFDILAESLKEMGSSVTNGVGAEVSGQKVPLPYYLGSQNKIKPSTGSFDRWVEKYPGEVCITPKMDGISALLEYKHGKKTLYTRGDGTMGQDISHLIEHMNMGNFKKELTYWAIRGELIMSKSNYEKSGGTKGPRALVSGLCNLKEVPADRIAQIKLIDFVVYEVIEPAGLTPLSQLQLLQSTSFTSVSYEVCKDITIEGLAVAFQATKRTSRYELDGLVIIHNAVYPRIDGKNPSHAFAFKMPTADQVATTTVIDVTWDASKDGYLKPTVQIEPVQIGNVIIQYATGFNAAFINKNGIGPGALMDIIRSGDVIPHIQTVHKPSPSGPSMPIVAWHWNDSEIEAIVDDQNHPAIKQRILLYFATTLDIGFCGEGTIKKLFDLGIETIHQLVHLEEDGLIANGWGKVSASKLIQSIKTATAKATMAQWAVGSGLFGRGMGIRRLEPALALLPADLSVPATLEDQVTVLHGWSRTTASPFARTVPAFLTWLDTVLPKEKKMIAATPPIKEETVRLGSLLENQVLLATGYRPKELVELVIQQGGVWSDTFSKKVTMVLVANDTVSNEKTKKAIAAGIPVMTDSEFRNKYHF